MKKFHIRLQFKAHETSELAVLSNYLNSKDTLYPLKEMATIALSSFWSPLAFRDVDITPQKKNGLTSDCIHRLKLQLQHFQQMKIRGANGNNEPGGYIIIEPKCQPGQLKNYTLRFQVSAQDNSNEAILLSYLVDSRLPYPLKDMAFTALSGFWLPFAYNNSNSVEKNQAIEASISRISLHIEYLSGMLTPVDPIEEDISSKAISLVKNSSPASVALKNSSPEKVASNNHVSPKRLDTWDPYSNS